MGGMRALWMGRSRIGIGSDSRMSREEVREMLDQLYTHDGMEGCWFGECDRSMRMRE
jgi:hypothetical protein